MDVYDLHIDPEETTPLVGLAPRALLQMQRGSWERGRVVRQIEPEKGEMDDETRKLLEELGYMGVDDEVVPEGEAASTPVKQDTGAN